MSERTRNSCPVIFFLATSLLLGLTGAASAQSMPGFSKAFSPDTIGPGSVSTLTFTIDNTGSGAPASLLAFTDILPAGMALASPAFVANSCGGTLGAVNGGDTVSLSDGTVGAGLTCQVIVNVEGSTTATNVSGDLTSDAGNSGMAVATLTVDSNRPGFSKSFAPGTVAFGGRSTLTFLIDNTLNGSAALFINFTDTLPANMLVASPANASTDCNYFSAPDLTADPGTSSIDLFSAGVAANALCSVTVDVIGGAVGTISNVSGVLTSNINNSALTSGKAAAVLEVTGFDTLLELQKDFTDDPVSPGGTVNLEFTVTNKSRNSEATAISFDDKIDPMGMSPQIVGLVPTLPPFPDPPCGPGSTLSYSGGFLTLIGGSLPASGSCTFSVSLAVPAGAAAGAYTNTTSAFSGLIDDNSEDGNLANDVLFVVLDPVLTKEFTDDPVGAGGSVTLSFTLLNVNAASGLTDLAFNDDLNSAIPGLAANSLVSGMTDDPMLDVCGPGSKLTVFNPPDFMFGGMTIVTPPDPTLLQFTGGSLAAAGMAGDSCTFDVVLDVPAGAPSGIYVNVSEDVNGNFTGPEPTTGKPASGDVVVVGAPTLSKQFIGDPAAPGGTVALEFTLSHSGDVDDPATGIAFSDDLTTLVPADIGLTAASVDTNTCVGATVDITTDPTQIDFSGGSLAPGETCVVSVTLSIPVGAAAGTKTNTTSEVTATVDGVAVAGAKALDSFLVSGFFITKEFTDDPVIAGGTATLQFTLDNTSGNVDATSIAFDDDLDAVLDGLVATGLPSSECGGTINGTSFLEFAGGSVVAGSSCSLSVELDVPAAAPDNVYTNTTEEEVANLGGAFIGLDPAIDQLVVNSTLLALSKEFTDDPALPGGSVNLAFELQNLSATETVADIAFSDDLDAVLSGLQVTGVIVNTCGGFIASSVPSGDFQFVQGTLSPGQSCVIELALELPAAPVPGNLFANTTSAVSGSVGGANVSGEPASDVLQVQNVTFSKAFTDDPAEPGGTATLQFTLKNSEGSALSNLAFSDDLDEVIPGMLVTGLPDNPVCNTGTVGLALDDDSFLTVSGASLAAMETCTIDVTVTVPPAEPPDPGVCGSFVNATSPLTQQGSPIADPATALLDVYAVPGAHIQSAGLVSMEAENFARRAAGIDGQWQVLEMLDPLLVSNSAAIMAAGGPPTTTPGAGSSVTYAALLEEGEQYVWFRARSADPFAKTFFFQLDDGPTIQTVTLSTITGEWGWARLDLPINIDPPDGELHTITIYRGDGLLELDKLFFIKDGLFDPDDLGPEGSDRLDNCLDTDGDGIPDVIDDDDDNDGMSDEFEEANGLDPLNPDDADDDPDNDGLTNLEEFEQGSNPNNPDTDGDGIGDANDDQPTVPNNSCTGGDAENAIFDDYVDTERTCVARISIEVLSPDTVVVDPGHLTLIAPLVSFEDGFVAGWLTVINDDPCPSCANTLPPKVIGTDPADGAIDVPLDSEIGITFNKPVTLAGDWFEMDCSMTGIYNPSGTGGTAVAVSDADPLFTLEPATDFAKNELCTVTVFAAAVTDDDNIDPPDNMLANYVFSFRTKADLDFGDAPDPTYPTLLASGGAHHAFPSALRLGTDIDAELDGQPDATATGDDLADLDDEDGVTLPTLLLDTTANVMVELSGPGGLLNAWVDFNRDGDWGDLDEQIFTDEPLSPGINNLSFGVPSGVAGASPGNSFARFRVDSGGGLEPTGRAADGEVEDYVVTIVDNSPPEITSYSGASSATDTIFENATLVEDIDSTDLQGDMDGPVNGPSEGLTYSISGGVDNTFFGVEPFSGILVFNSAPDFENPLDDGGDNIYDVQVTVTDSGGLTDFVDIAVEVTDVNDAPTVTTIGNETVAEDTATGPLAFTVDDDETAAGSLIVTASSSNQTLIPDANLTLGGAGAARTIDALPATNQNGGPATITVTVDDGTDTTDTMFNVTVTAVNDPPVIGADSYTTIGNVQLNVGASAPGTPHITASPNQPMTNNTDVDSTLTAGAFTTPPTKGSVILNVNGTFTYHPNPGATGADSFTFKVLEDGVDNGVTETVNITIGDMIWFINAAASGSNAGTSSNPFLGISSYNGSALPAAGDTIFVHDSSGLGSYSIGITLAANQTLHGEGAAFSATDPNNGSQSLSISSGSRPILTTESGDAITLASGNTIRGLDIANTAGTGINGTDVGTLFVEQVGILGTGGGVDLRSTTGAAIDVTLDSLSASSSSDEGILLSGVSGDFDITATSGTISTTGVPAIDISGAADPNEVDLGITFGSVSANGGAAGIELANTAGSLTVTGGTIENVTGRGFDAANVAGTVSIGASLANSGGRSVEISGSAGSFTFSGAIDENAEGINLSTNTGSFTFQGGIDIDTTGSNVSFNATGGGTVNVTGTNTIGGPGAAISGIGVDIDGVDIGTGGLTFASLAVDGANHGIRIRNAGGNATFGTVAIANTVQTSAQTFSPFSGANTRETPNENGNGDGIYLQDNTGTFAVNGGTITSSGDNAIDIFDAGGITVSNVIIDGSANTAVQGTRVAGLDIIDTTIRNFGNAVAVSTARENGISLREVTGAINLQRSTIDTGFGFVFERFAQLPENIGLELNNISTTSAATLTVTGSTITKLDFEGIQVRYQDSDVTVRLDGSTADGANALSLINGAAINFGQTAADGGSTGTLVVNDSTMTDVGIGTRVGNLSNTGGAPASVTNVRLEDNTVTRTFAEGFRLRGFGGPNRSTFDMRIIDNDIFDVGRAISTVGGAGQSGAGNGIESLLEDRIDAKILIDGNTIDDVTPDAGSLGVNIRTTDGTELDLVFTDNMVLDVGNPFQGATGSPTAIVEIGAFANSGEPNPDTCVHFTGNTLTPRPTSPAIFANLFLDDTSLAAKYILQGLSGGGDSVAASTFLDMSNTWPPAQFFTVGVANLLDAHASETCSLPPAIL